MYHMTLSLLILERLRYAQLLTSYLLNQTGKWLVFVMKGCKMERPASDEAIREFERRNRARYGDGIREASINLHKHPNDPKAHELYVREIGKMIRRARDGRA